MVCMVETQRLVYLITYSRADTVKFPTRESFGEAVLEGGSFLQMQTVIAMTRLTSIISIWL